ncbi:MAG: hypothetical protein JXR64_05295 [Spirochaetales bacterium]|nr:hypothetical protein [Spirochaetales bacterium]
MIKLFNRGLSTEEIAKALKKIRQEYNNYIITYMKPPRVKEEFERRYLFAAKYKENMALFFKNEIEILQDIITQEEDKKRQKEADKALLQQKRLRQKDGDFADKILKEYEERIKLYPAINITDDASIEVRKLYGAMKVFEDKYWNSLSKYIRIATPEGRVIDHLENDLWMIIGTGTRRPPILDKYIFLLERPDHDLQAISYAEQACMKQVAFFLNELMDLYKRSTMDSVPPGSAVDGFNYMNQIIFNFRLADLKKR